MEENVWKRFQEKSDPVLFILYLEGIVNRNDNCLDEEYKNCGEVPNEGPHLFTLPENLLEECDKFLKNAISKGQNIDIETLQQIETLMKALCVICRNLDNIPFVSSCEIVNYIMEVASSFIAELLEITESTCKHVEHKIALLKYVFYFLEILYDPYSTWRAWLAKKPVNRSLFQFTPAVLHVEVVPFFYDTLHYIPSHLPNKVQTHLLHVYGAIISGAQHNALSAITPATLEVLFSLVLERKSGLELKVLALKCITFSVGCVRGQVDQRQVDVRTIVETYFGHLLALCNSENFVNNISTIIVMLGGLRDMLNYHEEISVRKIMQENDYLNFLVDQIKKVDQNDLENKQDLTIAVVDTITSFIGKGIWPKRHFLSVLGFETLDKVLKSVGMPSQKLIDGIFHLASESLEDERHSIRNGQLVNTLLTLLLDIPCIDLQLYIVEKILTMCEADLYSRIICCQYGAIRTIIRILEKYTYLGGRTLGKLFRLLEVLGSHSIQPTDLKQLFRLLRLDKEGKQFAYTVQVIHILSTMTKNQGWLGATHFFDLREKFDGVGLHSIRKWPGTAFGFHAWLRLNKQPTQSEEGERQRRQLYSFLNSSGGGFEAFFTEEHHLVIAVALKREFYATAVVDNPLDDEKWHSVAICHSPARRPFTQSSVTVYIDGRQKLVAQLKFPVMTEPFVYCRVGVGGQIMSLSGRRHSDVSDPGERSGFISSFSDAAIGQLSTFIDKDRLFALGSKTLPHAFRGAFSAGEPDPAVQSCPIGSQDNVWGVPNCLNGQIGSLSLAHEVFLPNQLKAIYEAGPNCTTILSSEESPEFIDFTNKLIFHWDAKAFYGETCIDLAPLHIYDGQVTGNHCVTLNIKEVLNCIGGIPSLYPLLENAGKNANPVSSDFSGLSPQKPPLTAQMSEEQLNEEWVVLPCSSYSEWKLEQNQVAGFLLLLLHAIQGNVSNQEQILRQNGLDTIGALLQKVPNNLIDVNVLMATQLLVEGVSGCDNAADLLKAVYQFILFDFRIWSKGNFPVRIGHIQYLSTIIKDDRKFFRRKYGPQFFLDTIQTFYSSCDVANSEDIKTIRISLIGLVKYYLSRDVNVQEISAVLNYVISVKEEQLVFEMIETLYSLLESQQAKDQLYLLSYEPGAGELLYCLLFNTNYSTLLKVKVLKIINLLLKSDRVYEKSKTRLRLHDLGFSCLLTFLSPGQVSMEMIMLLTEQTLMTETVFAYQGLLSILHFIKHMDVEIKLETSKKLMSRLEQKPNSLSLITKQIGWQECVLSMLVKQAISGGKQIPITPLPSLDLIDLSQHETLDVDAQDISKSESPVFNRSTPRRLSRRSSSSLRSLEDSSNSPLPPRTPQFLMQLKEHIFDFDFPQLLGRSRSASLSSSTEDLSTAGNNDNRKSCVSLSGVSMAELDRLITEGTAAAQNEAKSRNNNSVTHQEKELCGIVAEITYLLMWKGIEGSGKSAWQERGMIFAYINLLALSNELYISHLEIKRIILEKALQACLVDLQEAGQANAVHTENAIELMKLVYDFVVLENVDDNRRLSEKLLESVLGLLDVLLVFEYSPGQDGWAEMAEMGLGVVLVCSATENLELCAMATAKLHALVQTRPFSSLEEACHLLATLDNILNKAIESGDQEHYSFLIPVVRALLEKLSPPLHLQKHLPGLPLASASGPAFFEEFQHYALSSEWKNFTEKTILPLQRKYTCLRVDEQKEQMNGFWNQCYEVSMIASHKRNREIGESKLRFQSSVMDVFHAKVTEEITRYQATLTSQKHQNIFVRRRWRMLKLYLYGPRGPWESNTPLVQHWKLSNHENSSRMRLKMTFNLNFDVHNHASRLRDNQGTGSGVQALNLSHLPPPVARVAQQQEDSLAEEDLQVSASEIEGLNETEKEKTVISDDCELVTLLSVVKGRFEVTTSDIYFLDLSPLKEEGDRHDFKCPLANLREIHLRRYNLRRSALEFFLVDQTNFFLNFTTKTRNKIYSRIISQRPPNLYYSYGIRSPAELLKASGVTNKWMHREMSNFEYLMVLNTIAGRTYNDLSQYPVFPWILADYVSEELDLDNPAVYRDLSKPIAIVNPKNVQEVKTKYDNFVDITGVVEKFHYGTHYSNSAGVLHYLVRVEPFTSLHIELQGGRFDVADRQFHSLEATWRMLMENPNDCKELIPEFFYLPEFLTNANGFDLGRLQGTKEKVDNVKLPPWASSCEDFIFKHRKALESEYVSSHLHEWIDLIFGYKQKGPAAVESLNVFYYVSYEGAVDLDAIQDPVERAATEGMINHFGQTPCQLLKEPHPRRMAFEEAMVRMSKNDTKPPSLFLFLQNLRTFFVEAYPTTTPIAFISLPKNQAKTFRQTTTTESLITVCQNGVLGVHSWLPYDKAKTIPFYYTFDKDPSLANNKSTRRIAGPFHPSVEVTHKLFAISLDAKLLISGGHWDCSIRAFSLVKSKNVAIIIKHQDIVTCLSLDAGGKHVMSGSRDTTCMVWQLKATSSGLILWNKPLQTLYGHDSEVTSVGLAMDLDMAVSGSKDGSINIHTVRDGHFTRTLSPPSSNPGNQEVSLLSLSPLGYLCVFCKQKDKSKGGDHCLHLYSINGKHLTQRSVTNSLTDIQITGDYLVTGSVEGVVTIFDVLRFQVLTEIPFHIPVITTCVTMGNTHILASLDDGKIIIIGSRPNILK